MNQTPLMSAEQCRAARVLLDITQEELALGSTTADKLVTTFEVRPSRARPNALARKLVVTENTITNMQLFLERRGITFLFRRNMPFGVMLGYSPIHDYPQEPPCPLHFLMARAWLGWSHRAFAKEADVSVSMIRDFEKRRHEPRNENMSKADVALRIAGIRYLWDNGGNPIGITVDQKAVAFAQAA